MLVPMHPLTATTAAVGLVVAGGAAGVALFERPDSAGVAATAARPAPVEVRTEVIHRTVHVVRHIRPKHRVAAPPAPAPVQAPPPPARAAVQAPAPRPTRPLRTHSSATGASHGDDGEHEGGDDD
jgi:hypothetical protein